MKTICGKCSAEIELPKEGESPEIRCPSCGALFVLPALSEGEKLPRPDAFPGYRLVALVGHGGMGAVYRAIQLSMDREVAIKVLLSKYSQVPRFVARFEREAAALAGLSHPNIVGVIDRGRVGDTYYFVMEYVHGRTLRYLIRNDLLSVERAVAIAIQICQALEAAHAHGIVHRDIKPGNILIQEDTGLVKVADFGIVHMVEGEGVEEAPQHSRVGTARYMAPEQRSTTEAVDGRADLYGLGVTLHEMLTRELPAGAPPSASNRFVPKELDAIVERATRPNRDERFQSAAEMRQALEAVREALKRDETPATITLPPLVLTCPACHEAVSAHESRCPGCGATVSEPCYRPDCRGLNPIGAERCDHCGGHIKLLEAQRRAELETLLRRAAAEMAAGALDDAARRLDEVAADPHAALKDLHERASEMRDRLLLMRPVSPWRGFLVAGVAVLAVGLGLLIYWRVGRSLRDMTGRDPDGQPGVTTTVRVETRLRPTTSAKMRPTTPTAKPRDAFTDYLLAVTAEDWPQRAPEFRLLAACEAVACLASGRGDGQAAKRLARTLAEPAPTEPPTPDALRAQAAVALDALCGMLARELARQPAAASRIRQIAGRYAQAAGSAREPLQKLDLAAVALYDLLAAAETTRGIRPDDRLVRLRLLDGTLSALAPPGDLGTAATRLVRAGWLLVRALRHDSDGSTAPELLNDAQGKLARAEQTPEPLAALAWGLEACVEALGARPSSRSPD